MKRLLLLIITAALVSCSYPEEKHKNEKKADITPEEVKDHIVFLASDEMRGRFTGTEEMKNAAAYIEEDMKSSGLKPFFKEGFTQSFPFVSGVKMSKENSLIIKSGKKNIRPDAVKQFVTAPFSDKLETSGSLVFAGYGITASDLNYDDYENIDVKGKVVVVMRHNPEISNPHTKFDMHSDLRLKAKIARDKGAEAIIFVNGYIPKDEDDNLIKVNYDGAPPVKGIAAFHIKRQLIDELFKEQGLNFREIQQKINNNKKPYSFELKNVSAEIKSDIQKLEGTGINVAGWIEGSDPVLKNEYVIIGAHFDHLGMGETGSLYRGKDPQVHNGADDNASGTAGVLELAEKFALSKGEVKRSIIFVAFSGEELGLLGSSYFVNNLSVPYKQVAAMLNMDMIGRMNEENALSIHGAGTSKIWKDMINRLNSSYNFKIGFNDEGYGPSDHSSFYAKEIPVLFFFTGTHTDYHRPTDDADKINNGKEAKVINLVYDIADEISSSINKPDYVNVPRKDSSGQMRFKVYVGTIPDYTSQTDGFKITGVSEGSPAQKGGLKGGDIIVEFGGKKVSNIYDYMYAMNSFAPGDVIDVVVLRNSEKVKLKLELAAR